MRAPKGMVEVEGSPKGCQMFIVEPKLDERVKILSSRIDIYDPQTKKWTTTKGDK